VIVTPSLERAWVKPLSTLRARGVACVVVSFDVGAYERFATDEDLRRRGLPAATPDPQLVAKRAQDERALRHALSEFGVSLHTVAPARPLGELLVS
jgi:hypothetical protein